MRTRTSYSQHARQALTTAHTLAKQYDHPGLDSSHLLVGILKTVDSVGSGVLVEIGLAAGQVEQAMQSISHAPWHLDASLQEPDWNAEISPGLHEALNMAEDEARWLGQAHIGTEHLLLGLARANEESLLVLLHLFEISPEQIRRQVRRLLQDGITEIGLEQAKRVARLSELSRRALNGAEQIAEQIGHREVGLAHLLLVLSREQRSICKVILQDAGLDSALIEANLAKARPATGGRLEGVIDRAVNRAEAFGSHYTGTDHLLLALALDARGARLLRRYKADPQVIIERLRAHFSR
jgi:ATP-dependent Clp protease ATP-binding subunit ClpA